MSPGRLLKVAATIVVGTAIAAGAAAGEPGGPIEISRADALQQWKLKASATRADWDPTAAIDLPRFDAREALGGETSRASLAFDWVRVAGAGRFEAAAFARASRVEAHSALASLDSASERLEQRDRRSVFAAALRWGGETPLGGLASSHSATLRVRGENADADAVLAAPGREPFETVRSDRLRQANAGFDLASEVELAGRLRAIATLRHDSYRFDVRSDRAALAGAASGSILAPRIALIADLPGGSTLFADMRRGLPPGDPRVPGAVVDPRSGAAAGRIDPSASLATAEIGVRGSVLRNTSSAISLFRSRAQSQLAFAGDVGLAVIERAAIRSGVDIATRYEPAPWLALDVHAVMQRVRAADGGAYLPGANERGMSAAATLRAPNGWTASLLVNYLGRRPAAEDGGASWRASSLVNGRLTRSLSKTTRVTFDVFNVFDQRVRDVDYLSAARFWNQPGAADSFFFDPAEPRGFRLKLRTTF